MRGVIVPEEKAEFGKLKLDACYVDIGAKDEEQARRMVQVGDTAVYDTAIFLSGDKVISPYLDNRISCAVLLRVLEELDACPNDLYLVFSAQEEVGLRGARTAAWSIDPDYALAVDVTDVDDTPGSEKLGTVRLGQGAAVKVMDRSVICHPGWWRPWSVWPVRERSPFSGILCGEAAPTRGPSTPPVWECSQEAFQSPAGISTPPRRWLTWGMQRPA